MVRQRARSILAFSVNFAAIALCTGCASIGNRVFEPNSNPIYSGTRIDCSQIATHDSEPPLGRGVGVVDLPFSLVLDTLLFPVDIVHFSEQPSSIDPLKQWNNVGGSGSFARDHWPPESDSNIPFGKVISNDVANFISSSKFKYGPDSAQFACCGGMEYYEDGVGGHAVKIQIPLNSRSTTSEFYILFYDKNDIRIKVIKYRQWTDAHWRT